MMQEDYIPLSVRLRPRNLEEFVGQRHILGKDKLLYRLIKEDKIPSMILYGPPGSGKTSLAEIIKNNTNSKFVSINATTAGINEIKKILEEAYLEKKINHRKTILLIEEFHRFNKHQQDILLQDVEHSNITIIGTTTQNPYFAISSPLISRCIVFKLEELSSEDLSIIIKRALQDRERGLGKYNINLAKEAEELIIKYSDNDARWVLQALELGVLVAPKRNGMIDFDLKTAQVILQEKKIVYDKKDEHYDTISAFIKSMRGSDPDATIYWLAKMLYAGEDPRFIARRILVHAAEDVGLADPQALILAAAAAYAIEYVGMPEAKVILAEAALYIACAPKSNSSYKAINEAILDIKKEKTKEVPQHLKTSSKDYLYPHDYKDCFVKQEYLPGKKKRYYSAQEVGFEKKIKERLERLWQE